ncbi:MAG: GDP-mannose 4,6-dehydratase [Candidatus Margulisiibacteriota bacterium]|jgi:GDP-4-dehydro-6-deoxy-D-mannose reductase
MKILITGITGFVGSHLAEYCLTIPGAEVYGTIMFHHLGDELERIEHIKSKVELLECDLTNRIAVDRVLQKIKPDKIFHLAAQSFVKVSWDSPEETIFTNIMAELNIFESCRSLGINPIIQIAGSSEEYGLVLENEVPIKETNPLRPLSPYAVSKIGQEMLAYQYYKSYGLKTILTRAFNHEGPGRGEHFVTSTFAKQIAQIEKGKQEPIVKVGNLSTQRDYTDARDMVKAYWLATEKCEFGKPYNICSGKAWKIEKVLEFLLSLSTMKDIKTEQDPERMRPSDVQILLGDCSEFKKATGWEPEITFEKTLEDLLNYWRRKV